MNNDFDSSMSCPPQPIVYCSETHQQPIMQQQVPPPSPPAQWIRSLTQEEADGINKIINSSEELTASLASVWEVRAGLRQAVAQMVCPFQIGTILILGDGRAPNARRVVTLVTGGCTEKGEFYRCKTRVLTKGMQTGKRSMWLKPDDSGYRIEGMFPQIDMLPKEELEEDRII